MDDTLLLFDGQAWTCMGSILRKMREARGWTQRNLMDCLGYKSIVSIDALESHGKLSGLSLHRFLLIQYNLGHELDSFFGFEAEQAKVLQHSDSHRLIRAFALLGADARAMLVSHAEKLATPAVEEETAERHKLMAQTVKLAS